MGKQHAKGNPPNSTSFRKGDSPWNKDTIGLSKANSGSFKAGQKGINWMPVGTVVHRKDHGSHRNFIKIEEPNKWKYYAQYLWEKQYGQIINGDVVHHLNGTGVDDRIENLIALPRKDHPIYHNHSGVKTIETEQMAYYLSRYSSAEYCEIAKNRVETVQLEGIFD